MKKALESPGNNSHPITKWQMLGFRRQMAKFQGIGGREQSLTISDFLHI